METIFSNRVDFEYMNSDESDNFDDEFYDGSKVVGSSNLQKQSKDLDIFEGEMCNIRERSTKLLEKILNLPKPEKLQQQQTKPKNKNNKNKKKSSLSSPTKDNPKHLEKLEKKLQMYQGELLKLKRVNVYLKSKIKNCQVKLQESQKEEEDTKKLIKKSESKRYYVPKNKIEYLTPLDGNLRNLIELEEYK